MGDTAWVPWALTAIGWIVAGKVAFQNQKKTLAMQARNAARLEIAKSIRAYQDWLSGLTTFTLSLPYSLDDIEQGHPWAKSRGALWDEGRKRAYPEDSDQAVGWILMLEEYEILFPKTREVRLGLFDYNARLAQHLNDLLFSLGPKEDPAKSRVLARSVYEQAGELGAFMHDIGVFLQNETLGEVTGARVPYRIPGDPSVSRILLRADGTPYIVPATAPPAGKEKQVGGVGATDQGKRLQ